MGVNVVIFGDSTLVDLREDTVKPENLFLGETAHGKDGNQVVGTFTIEDEINEQDILIEQIQTALQGKAAGSGGSSGSDPVIRALSVTENGTYEAPTGVDGYSPVVVEVPVPDVPDPVDQATPVITVSDSGLITAKATQGAGVVAAGTKSATKQLTTKGATTITPGASVQTVVSAGTFVTGDIKVAAAVNEDLEAILDEQETLIATLQETLRGKMVGGGDDVAGAIADRTVTEFVSNKAAAVGHSAFRACTKLEKVDAPNATTVADYAFYQCSALTTLNLPSATSIGQYVVNGCNELRSVVFPSVTSVSQNALREAQYLETIDLPKLTSIPAQTFYGCRGLKTLILRSETLVTLANTNAFTTCYRILGTKNAGFNPNGEKIGFIYVPKALLEDYKVATNWSSDSLVTQLRAIEDYPEICGG